MNKTLVIAEKPSVARDIAKVLKCNKKGLGCLIGDGYIVTWAIGHLITLMEPEEYDIKYKKWTYETLPIIPVKMGLKPVDATKSQYNIVKALMNDAEVANLICATDSGREGELIFRYIYELSGCNKSFKRLWISSMTDAAIMDGFNKLKPGEDYDNLFLSARCRSEADWLVGMNASRAFTIKYNTLLSIGRVQTPTLAIIVERQKEINAFLTMDYYEVFADFDGFKGLWINIETKETKIIDENIAKEIAAKVMDKSGRVAEVVHEDKKMPAPLLYDLTELQRDANKKMGFTAQKTLTIAQDLYEKRKLITYPRTDSRYLSTDMIPKLKSILYKIRTYPYELYIDYLLKLEELPLSKRIIDDTKISDHHAIIPTEMKADISKLTSDEAKIYDLIVKRFICIFYPSYLYKLTRILCEVEGEFFQSKGKVILKLGWMELYKNDEKKDKDEEEQELPNLEKEQIVKIVKAEVNKKKTKPPSAYTEASLLSAMENAGRFVEDEQLKEQLKEGGLGTPATRASIIERLIKVGYIIRKGKGLIPTEKGMKLIEVVPFELKSPETTGKWEKGLSSIAKGKMQSERFKQSIERYVRYIVQKSREASNEVLFKEDSRTKVQKEIPKNIGNCPICKTGYILEHEKGFFCTNWRQGCKFSLWKNNFERVGKVLNSDMAREIIKAKEVNN